MLDEYLPHFAADALDADVDPLDTHRHLIRVESLLRLLGDATDAAPLVLDVRNPFAGPGRAAYDSGHIPGAVYVDLETELSDPPGDPVDGRGRHPQPAPERFVAAMRRVGVSEDRANPWVVVYDEGNGSFASRLWWLLRDYGYARVQVLSGGLAEWQRLGGRLSSEPEEPEPGDWSGSPGAMPTIDAVEAAALTRSGLLIDVRAPERYAGRTEPIDPVAGHIPGAVNVPFTAVLDEHGKPGAPSSIAELYRRAGAGSDVGPDVGGAIGVYCGSGVTATHTVLALACAGFEAALYAPSWSGWIADPEHPVATGDHP